MTTLQYTCAMCYICKHCSHYTDRIQYNVELASLLYCMRMLKRVAKKCVCTEDTNKMHNDVVTVV